MLKPASSNWTDFESHEEYELWKRQSRSTWVFGPIAVPLSEAVPFPRSTDELKED